MKAEELWSVFSRQGLNYFTGVPDSTFKGWMTFLEENNGEFLINRIVSIERDAIGLAAGYFVATGKIPIVYMQNAGLGNVINPITSLVDPLVYKIPLLLMVGWRGKPGEKDEPQHTKMGEITLGTLNLLGIKYKILPAEFELAKDIVEEAVEFIKRTGESFALVVPKKVIEDYGKKLADISEYKMSREEAIATVIDGLRGNEAVISTTGKTSRELFEYREAKCSGHQNDFLMVGSMGEAAPFGLEIALQLKNKPVFIFDGDGAVLMSAGALSTVGYYAPQNFFHFIFDNNAYESTGGQKTTSDRVDFEQLALANGYKGAKTVKTKEELQLIIKEIRGLSGPQMVIVKVKKGARKELGRPTITPLENKEAFVRFLREE